MRLYAATNRVTHGRKAGPSLPAALRRRAATAGALAALVLGAAPAQAAGGDIEGRIEGAFGLVQENPARIAVPLTLRRLAHVPAAEIPLPRHARRSAPAERQVAAAHPVATGEAQREPMPREVAPLAYAEAGPTNAPILSALARQAALARLPKPRPEHGVTTASLASALPRETAPAPEPRAADESAYFGRYAGSFAGSGEVRRTAQESPNQVKCTLTGRPTADGVSIAGKCGAFIFSRDVSADVRYDAATGLYTGTYIGSDAGPAKLLGRRSGDAVVLTITWPKVINGDTKATMTIRNAGNGQLAISVVDDVRPGGPKAEVTRLALSQS